MYSEELQLLRLDGPSSLGFGPHGSESFRFDMVISISTSRIVLASHLYPSITRSRTIIGRLGMLRKAVRKGCTSQASAEAMMYMPEDGMVVLLATLSHNVSYLSMWTTREAACTQPLT